MKRIHADDVKQSTQIEFRPVIEGDPNDLNTIRLSADRVVIVTFDLFYLDEGCGYYKAGKSAHHCKVGRISPAEVLSWDQWVKSCRILDYWR